MPKELADLVDDNFVVGVHGSDDAKRVLVALAGVADHRGVVKIEVGGKLVAARVSAPGQVPLQNRAQRRALARERRR